MMFRFFVLFFLICLYSFLFILHRYEHDQINGIQLSCLETLFSHLVISE